jgi:hypothetical protein
VWEQIDAANVKLFDDLEKVPKGTVVLAAAENARCCSIRRGFARHRCIPAALLPLLVRVKNIVSAHGVVTSRLSIDFQLTKSKAFHWPWIKAILHAGSI